MRKILPLADKGKTNLMLPTIIEQDEDGGYVIECPLLPGCYAQGETMEEAFNNIRDVIALIAEEESCKHIIESYRSNTVTFHTISVSLD